MPEPASKRRDVNVLASLRAWLTTALVVVLLWMVNAIRADVRSVSEKLQVLEEKNTALQSSQDDGARQLSLISQHVDRLLGYVDAYLPGLARSPIPNPAGQK
jgi:hypothetical protein